MDSEDGRGEEALDGGFLSGFCMVLCMVLCMFSLFLEKNTFSLDVCFLVNSNLLFVLLLFFVCL